MRGYVIKTRKKSECMNENMNKKLENSLLQGKYGVAEDICKNIDEEKMQNILLNMAYDTEGIYVYSFVQYMIKKTQKASWIGAAIELMLHPLCFLEGAYSVALFHARELLSINRNSENLERILYFYHIPEKLVDKKEALLIAEELLKLEPDNRVALEVCGHDITTGEE